MNHVIIKGILNAVPESQENAGDIKQASISLTVKGHYDNSEDNNQQEVTQWLRVILYENLATYALTQLATGDEVIIAGQFQKQHCLNSTKINQGAAELIASSLYVTLLSSKRQPRDK